MALVALAISACDTRTSVGDIDASPARLEPLPGKILKSCRAVPRLGPACPTMVPSWSGRVRSYDAHLPGTWGFVMEVGEPAAPLSEAPPQTVHLNVFTGAEVAEPARNLRPAPNFERPLRWRWHPWLIDEDVTWNGRTGRVVLWPENPTEIESDHVSFDWVEDGRYYRVSLKAWRPVEESVATLRAVVGSIGNGKTDSAEV